MRYSLNEVNRYAAILKLTPCTYTDTCDFCDYPVGTNWKFESEGKIIYHVCSKCIPSIVKTILDAPFEELPF